MLSIALIAAASLAALIAFYFAMVRTASFVDEMDSGIPAPEAEPEVELRRAA
jgi:hypothetical protein